MRPISIPISLVASIVALAAAAPEAHALPTQRKGYSITFEAGDGQADGWARAGTPATLWQSGAPTQGPLASNSGSKCMALDLASDYPDDADVSLDSPVYDMAGAAHPRLEFFHYMDSEDTFDGGQLLISRNGGAFVTVTADDAGWLLNGPNMDAVDALGGGPGWSGLIGGYVPVVLDLAALSTPGLTSMTAREKVQFRFHFASDSSVGYPGWFIDDVQFRSGGSLPVKTYAGTTTGKPRWNRVDASGVTTTTNVSFETQPFIVPEDGGGTYTITASWDGFDGFLFLYSLPFSPSSPASHFVAADDDFAGPNATSSYDGSQISGVKLEGGKPYVIVASGYSSAESGDYAVEISGQSKVRLLAGGATTIDAAMEGTPRTGELPLHVTFKDVSVGPVVSRLWTFGDGATSTERNPTHTYVRGGEFDVTLAIDTGAGQSTVVEQSFVDVAVGELPKRKDKSSSMACAIGAGPASAAQAAGGVGPLVAALLAAAGVARRGRARRAESPAA